MNGHGLSDGDCRTARIKFENGSAWLILLLF